jgi:hypothetical protein
VSDWASFYAELKGWQTAVGSVLGFIALVCGALINYNLNRKRDQRLRDEEIAAVGCALYGEMLLLRQSTARLAQFVGSRYLKRGFRDEGEQFDKYFREMVEIPPHRVYDALVGKIGILPAAIALEITKFYAHIEEVQAWLPRLQDDPERKYSYSVASVIRPALDAVKQIILTLRELETLNDIPPASLDVKIDKAEAAMEMEEDFWSMQEDEKKEQ